jgi:hypothetical protein
MQWSSAEMAASPSAPGGKAGLLHQVVDQVGDAPRVLALQEGQQVVQQREQRQVRAVVVALAPAGDAVVGVHRHDDAGPVLVARHEDAQSVDFHALSLQFFRC